MFFRDRLVGWPRADEPTVAATGRLHLSSGQPDQNPWSMLTLPQDRLPDLRACKMLQILNLCFGIVARPERDSAAVALTQSGLRTCGGRGGAPHSSRRGLPSTAKATHVPRYHA